MTDERESREHDHLVEPLFAALEEAPRAERGLAPGRRRRLLLAVALLAAVALSLLLVIAVR